MRIYVDRQTHMPFYLPIQCPVGFCEPGVSAGEDCCGCYRRPPPPCGRCGDDGDIELEDEFSSLDPGWIPDFQCEPDYTPSPWCLWYADGRLVCDSYYYDGTTPDGPHSIFHGFAEPFHYFRADIDFVDCLVSSEILYKSLMSISFNAVTVEYRAEGQNFGLIYHTTRIYYPGGDVPFGDLAPPYRVSISITDNDDHGRLCVAIDDEKYLDINLTSGPYWQTGVTLTGGGDHGRFPGYQTRERIVEFDNLCISSIAPPALASEALRKWLVLVNA